MSSEKVVIVGAGVAGLSLAIMLAERGIECQVLEARHRFDGPTSGVRVSRQGVEILKFMNLETVGEETQQTDMRFGCLSASFKEPEGATSSITVTRLALHEKLLQRTRALGVVVWTGFEFASATESPDVITATSRLDEVVTGTLLVGADGVGSSIRRLLNPGQTSSKTYAGYLGVGFITKCENKIEMTLHNYPGHQVGSASCGKTHEAACGKSVFMWTHIRMSEADAKLASQASVEAELARRAERWSPELRRLYQMYVEDAERILSYGPVYNGTPPSHWFSARMILIGDAAHPYGPGGQGISMALKDAKALCDVIARGFTEADKSTFQSYRAEEARRLGEAAEKRNRKDSSSTRLGLLVDGIAMKAMEIYTGGTIRMGV